MRIVYLIVAFISLLSVALSISCIATPEWRSDKRPNQNLETNYGLFAIEFCSGKGESSFCYFTYYKSAKTGTYYTYYKAGAIGAAFMVSGMTLTFVFMIFMFIKATSGMAGRCMHRIINHYYGLYYLGIIAVFLSALGWGLYYHYSPKSYKLGFPFWITMVNWMVMTCGVAAVFIRKILQGNAKRGGWMNISSQ